MPVSNAETQRRLREFDSPTCGYRMGEDGEIECEVFETKLPKGWADSPANVTAKRTKAKAVPDDVPEPDDGWDVVLDQPATDPQPATIPAEGLSPPYDQYGFTDLRAELKRRTGKGPRYGSTTLDIVAMLEATDGDTG